MRTRTRTKAAKRIERSMLIFDEEERDIQAGCTLMQRTITLRGLYRVGDGWSILI